MNHAQEPQNTSISWGEYKSAGNVYALWKQIHSRSDQSQDAAIATHLLLCGNSFQMVAEVLAHSPVLQQKISEVASNQAKRAVVETYITHIICGAANLSSISTSQVKEVDWQNLDCLSMSDR
ncbi:hypothetical protein ACQ4M3_07660 [Leptolyngbya sp. AN03gr2]|uniref:hypothetical protein n=1 Tax=unclassified Leptolyngbya TaxID=2650499 RepID=UPI003D3217D5